MKSLEEIGCGYRCTHVGRGGWRSRTEWSKGPWDDEPDRVDFVHAGLPCLLHRNGHGVWCGYVAVAPGHPFYGVQYMACAKGCPPKPYIELETDDPDAENIKRLYNNPSMRKWKQEHPDYECGYEHSPEHLLNVHGGITYSGACQGHLCHIPKEGEPDVVWWFGFDCGHAFDLSPGLRAFESREFPELPGPLGESYRDMAYAKAETEQLAEQLAAMRTVADSPK